MVEVKEKVNTSSDHYIFYLQGQNTQKSVTFTVMV